MCCCWRFFLCISSLTCDVALLFSLLRVVLGAPLTKRQRIKPVSSFPFPLIVSLPPSLLYSLHPSPHHLSSLFFGHLLFFFSISFCPNIVIIPFILLQPLWVRVCVCVLFFFTTVFMVLANSAINLPIVYGAATINWVIQHQELNWHNHLLILVFFLLWSFCPTKQNIIY